MCGCYGPNMLKLLKKTENFDIIYIYDCRIVGAACSETIRNHF